MSYKTSYKINDFFDYVVPPLEGFWQQTGLKSYDCTQKERFEFISVIRLPDFVKKADFDWAVSESSRKKNLNRSISEFLTILTINEGICVQMMHKGAFDTEPASINQMHKFSQEQRFMLYINETRQHHEIYLSDFNRTNPEKMKTVFRHPIKKLIEGEALH